MVTSTTFSNCRTSARSSSKKFGDFFLKSASGSSTSIRIGSFTETLKPWTSSWIKIKKSKSEILASPKCSPVMSSHKLWLEHPSISPPNFAKKNLITKRVTFGPSGAFYTSSAPFGTHSRPRTKAPSFWRSFEESTIIVSFFRYAPIPELYSSDLKEIIDLCLERDYKRRPTTSNILSRPSTLLLI